MRTTILALSMWALPACGLSFGLDATGEAALQALSARVYRVESNGLVCVRYPCPNIDVTPVDGGETVVVSEVECPSSMPEEEQIQLMQRRSAPGGLTAHGWVNQAVEGGVFVLASVVEN